MDKVRPYVFFLSFGRFGAKWVERNDQKRIDLQTSLGFAFLTAVEVLDGFFFRMGCFLEI
jgi:hypothetical protein